MGARRKNPSSPVFRRAGSYRPRGWQARRHPGGFCCCLFFGLCRGGPLCACEDPLAVWIRSPRGVLALATRTKDPQQQCVCGVFSAPHALRAAGPPRDRARVRSFFCQRAARVASAIRAWGGLPPPRGGSLGGRFHVDRSTSPSPRGPPPDSTGARAFWRARSASV